MTTFLVVVVVLLVGAVGALLARLRLAGRPGTSGPDIDSRPAAAPDGPAQQPPGRAAGSSGAGSGDAGPVAGGTADPASPGGSAPPTSGSSGAGSVGTDAVAGGTADPVPLDARSSPGPAAAGSVGADGVAGSRIHALVDDRRPGGPAEDELVALRAEARQDAADARAEAEATRAEAEAAAAAVRAEADATRTDAESAAATARRLAEQDADAVRTAARSEAEATRAALRADTEQLRRAAELEASTTLLDARRQAERDAAEITGSARALKLDLERREARLADREERVDALARRVEQRSHELAEAEQAVAERDRLLAERETEHERELERIAGLTAADARAELMKAVEERTRREAAILVRDLEAEAQAHGEQRARTIVVDAIQRVASEQTAESVVSVLHLPADEMKGRIIGREGRNIRAFESVTGVNLIIDDTPEAVLLSCFDPVRREVGRITLEKLVLDGRIHPHRIEEVYERSKDEVAALCLRAGEDALVEVGISGLHPELLAVLGRLRYRTSYGQNVLKHLVETAHIAGIMAAELGLEPAVIKRGAFLHDIGKALTHEVEGSHALIGAELARKYGESEDVAHAIEAHHNEVAPRTVAAVLTQAADSCSGGRPGARRESLESYVKRLARIEEIASAKPGVERVFAMQAGREVRVMVQPEQVDDLTAQLLAREVAQQIEDELTYPGQIRVTVVRESRATEVAH